MSSIVFGKKLGKVLSQIEELYGQGLSREAVAKAVNLDPQQVTSYVFEYNLDISSGKKRKNEDDIEDLVDMFSR